MFLENAGFILILSLVIFVLALTISIVNYIYHVRELRTIEERINKIDKNYLDQINKFNRFRNLYKCIEYINLLNSLDYITETRVILFPISKLNINQYNIDESYNIIVKLRVKFDDNVENDELIELSGSSKDINYILGELDAQYQEYLLRNGV